MPELTTNPKDRLAREEGRDRLDLLEPKAMREIAKAMEFGAITKGYGIRNYLATPVSARVYVAAMMRHLCDWLDGESLAPDSGVHHLGHVGANVNILLAAMERGSLVDDRAPENA